MHAGFYAKCPLVNTIVMSQRIVVNIRNTQIHNNAFSMKTDGQKCTKELKRRISVAFFPEIPQRATG
jgi:hypothetical protein